MNPDDLYSADPEKILKRAMSDVRFARSGFEAGHETKALLLVIRGIEKMLLFHLMERNIPYSRDSSSLNELLCSLMNTPVYTEDREDLCSMLDAFQFEQEDEVMDIIQSEGQYKTLDELDSEDVQEAASEEFDEDELNEDLEDWDNDEWGPNGWSKDGDVDVDGFEMDAFETGADETEPVSSDQESSGNSSAADADRSLPDPSELPSREEMYDRALQLFKELSNLVDETNENSGSDGGS
jgi:hypothetical protein